MTAPLVFNEALLPEKNTRQNKLVFLMIGLQMSKFDWFSLLSRQLYHRFQSLNSGY